MADNQISQHKLMAMGRGIGHESSKTPAKFAKGGATPLLKTGIPTSPLTDAKRANGVPGFSKGGKSK